MNYLERDLIVNLVHAEEDLSAWYPWHCSNTVCDHHMCKVRSRKIRRLELVIRDLDIRLKIIKEYKRLHI